MVAAGCGALASVPLFVGACGFVANWNVFTNLSLILGSGVLWLTLWKVWSNG
jgi:hypothetical protein